MSVTEGIEDLKETAQCIIEEEKKMKKTEDLKAYMKQYRIDNKEKTKQRLKEWKEKNPDKVKLYYKKKRENADNLTILSQRATLVAQINKTEKKIEKLQKYLKECQDKFSQF